MGGYQRIQRPGRSTASHTTSTQAPRGGLAALRAADGERSRPRPPARGDGGRCKLINGPEAFTPDGEFILGPTDVRGLWIGRRFCAHGLAVAGGMGRLVAEWIVEGTPSLDSWEMDSRRFGAAYTRRDVHAGAHERGVLDLLRREVPGARAAGRAAAPRLAGLRAAAGARRVVRREVGLGAGELVRAERRARRRVAAPARLGGPALVARDRRRAPRVPRVGGALRRDVVREDRGGGAGAAAFLERLCANRVARDVGQITYTQMLNARGGIECDFTVTRLAEDRFRLVTGTAFGQHDLAWIRSTRPRRSVRRRRHVALRLLRSVGPQGARDPPAADDDDLSNFPYMHARELAVGPVPCLALRVTYVGELGWELYCPTEFGLALWDTIWEAGQKHGLVAGGYKAIDSLRLEKGYRVVGLRHHARGHAVRGRTRVRGEARQGRLHRSRGAAARDEPGGGSAASCSTTRGRSRSARSRCGSTAPRSAASPAAATATRSRSRSRTRTSRPRVERRYRGRGRDLRRVGAGRRRSTSRSTTRQGRGFAREALEHRRARVARRGRPVEALGGGITNHNFKVEVGGETFVLRVAGKDTELLGIDRGVELAATSAAADLGIGPEVVAFVEPEGWLVTRFVEGEVGRAHARAGRRAGGDGAARLHEGPALQGGSTRSAWWSVPRDGGGARRELPPAFAWAQAVATGSRRDGAGARPSRATTTS